MLLKELQKICEEHEYVNKTTEMVIGTYRTIANIKIGSEK